MEILKWFFHELGREEKDIGIRIYKKILQERTREFMRSWIHFFVFLTTRNAEKYKDRLISLLLLFFGIAISLLIINFLFSLIRLLLNRACFSVLNRRETSLWLWKFSNINLAFEFFFFFFWRISPVISRRIKVNLEVEIAFSLMHRWREANESFSCDGGFLKTKLWLRIYIY